MKKKSLEIVDVRKFMGIKALTYDVASKTLVFNHNILNNPWETQIPLIMIVFSHGLDIIQNYWCTFYCIRPF